MRRALGWGEDCTVLFYHGNVHPTNQAGPQALCRSAAFERNRGTNEAFRTGRDFGDFLGELGSKVKST